MSRTDAISVVRIRHLRSREDERRAPTGPGQRAFEATEASRRAREPSGRTRPSYVEPTLVPRAFGDEPTLVPQEPRLEPTRAYPKVPGLPDPRMDAERPRTPRRSHGPQTLMLLAVVAVGAMVLALSPVVIVLYTTGHTGSYTPSPTSPRITQGQHATAPSRGPSGSAAQPGSATTAPTTTVPPLRAVGSVPELTGLVPSAGVAGETLAVSGVNLFSPDGHVQAYVDSQPAATICPSQTSCSVTVPALSGSARTVALTVTTQAGTSNSLSFSYG